MDGESTINPNTSTSQAKPVAPIDASASAFTPSKKFSTGWAEGNPTGGFGADAFSVASKPTESKSAFVAGNNSNIAGPAYQGVSSQSDTLCRLCNEQPAYSMKGVCTSCFEELAQGYPQKKQPAVVAKSQEVPKPNHDAPVRKCIECGTTQGFIHKKGTCRPCFELLRKAQAEHDASVKPSSKSNERAIEAPKAEKSMDIVPTYETENSRIAQLMLSNEGIMGRFYHREASVPRAFDVTHNGSRIRVEGSDRETMRQDFADLAQVYHSDLFAKRGK